MKERINRKEQIIHCAKELFFSKGLKETVMDDVAVMCGISRRTLYRYHSSKEDLIYDVFIQEFTKWNDYQENAYKKLRGNGLEKFVEFTKHITGYLEDSLSFLKFVGDFDNYFKDSASYNVSEEYLEKFNNIIYVSDDLFKSIFQEGINDGSMEINEDLDLVVLTVTNVLWSLGQRIASRRGILEKEYHINPIKMIEYQLRLYASEFSSSKKEGERSE